MKETHETMEKLEEFMTNKVYGKGGTMDKTLKIRGNPKVFFDITARRSGRYVRCSCVRTSCQRRRRTSCSCA